MTLALILCAAFPTSAAAAEDKRDFAVITQSSLDPGTPPLLGG
jgi:hypothetical protein